MMQAQTLMKNVRLLLILRFLLLLVRPVSATTVPYTPSHAMVSPPQNDTLVYLLLPDSLGSDEHRTEFFSLDVSQTVDGTSPNYTTLLHKTPFRAENPTAAFVPVIDHHGNIKVYVGDCQNTSDPGAVWQFTPDPDSSIGNGTWERHAINTTEHQTSGPDYLAAGFAYAVTDATESSVYSFGGMCPNNNASANWITAANYSQAMSVLEPSSDKGTSYRLDFVGKRAPPIAEAGFTVTPLLPMHSMTTKDRVLQQRDFLFIGGQTQKAFLNMSELAIYSLPQDSWSFVSVGSDSAGAKTELAVRDTPQVEPRSGHTAVLSADGSKVIVVGGWVGNTTVPAHPQMAVLEIGRDHGGYGSWTWTIPSTEDSFLSDGSGIYGHGTAMLPGGMMMVTGGYRISKSPKRSTAGPQSNSQVYFYNVTSNSWTTSYTNPNWQPPTTNTSQASSGGLTTGQKAGIGVGIGVGIPILAAIGLLAWKYSRKYRFRRTRDNKLRELALGAHRAHFWGQDEPEMASSIRPSLSNSNSDRSYPWVGNRGTAKPGRSNSGDATIAEKTGLLMGSLASSRSNRQKPSYRLIAQSGGNRRSDPRSSSIHPIDERDEDEVYASDALIAHDRYTTAPQSLLGEVDIPDPIIEAPFLTPMSTIIENGQENKLAALEQHAFLTSVDDGPSTPSERRVRRPSSQSSPQTLRLGSVPKSRATIFYNQGSGPNQSAVASTHSKEETGRVRADSASDKRPSSESYSTAHTSVSQRRAEGEHLLREVPEPPEEGSSEPIIPIELPSKVAATPQRPKRAEWFAGSVRRVFSEGRKWANLDKAFNENTKNALATKFSGLSRSKTMSDSKKSSQNTDQKTPVSPRRAVSASAEYFRRKQGAKDWGASPGPSNQQSSTHIPSDGSTEADPMLEQEDDEEADWDIEAAAENRSVQVTFTVPKERLRVVNAMPGDVDSISEISHSRSGKGEHQRVVSG